MGRVVFDLLGQRFGSLVVKRKLPRERKENGTMAPIMWYCECDCGGNVTVNTFRLTSGEKTHCPNCKGAAKEQPNISYVTLAYKCPSPCSGCDGQFRHGICCNDCITKGCDNRCLNDKKACMNYYRDRSKPE